MANSQYLQIPANVEALHRLDAFITSAVGSYDAATAARVRLAVHEVCLNIIEHAYTGQDGEIELELVMDGAQLEIVVRDFAPSLFDLGSRPLPPNPFDLPEGGWGLHIVFSVMDRVEHRRMADGNEWLLVKQLS
ncbi:MAG: ATP-binding protein [Aggregatilineales bacterium]